MKKTVHNELRDKFDEVDNGSAAAGTLNGNCVLPSKINPDVPGPPPPMHIPMSTAIRVLQERERKESEMNQMNRAQSPVSPSAPPQQITTATKTPPQSRNGTLGRDGTLSGEKLMISHGKRNFSTSTNSTSTTPRKITIRNEKLVPKKNLLGGEGNMSSDLKKLIAADEKPIDLLPPPTTPKTPAVKSPQPLLTNNPNPNEFREKHLRSPDAIQISNTLKRLITQEKRQDINTVPFKADGVALPEDHQISDQLKKLILEDMNKPERPNTPSSATISQSSSISSIPEVERKAPQIGYAKPIMRADHAAVTKSNSRPNAKNGSLIDCNIRIPLPPRVPSPPPLDNPRRLDTQLSCDRLNTEFQEFNAYRVASPPSPKKIAIPMDPNGPANFEKKTVVSFAHDLAATPNRYPDTVKVVKLVQNGEVRQKLAMDNIKFIIDPENESVVQVSN